MPTPSVSKHLWVSLELEFTAGIHKYGKEVLPNDFGSVHFYLGFCEKFCNHIIDVSSLMFHLLPFFRGLL